MGSPVKLMAAGKGPHQGIGPPVRAWLTELMTSTERRSVALAVLASVLFIAVLAPRVTGRVVSGLPQATAVPGQPSIGDCITGPVEPSWSESFAQLSEPGTTATTYSYPMMNVKSCTGSRFGEVVSVIANPAKPVVIPDGASSSTTDANLDSCTAAAQSYAGLAVPTRDSTPTAIEWGQPNSGLGVAASSPSVRQKAAGQHWLACVVFILAPGGTAAQLRAQQRYDQSLRAALINGHERDRLGACFPGEDLDSSAVGANGACGAAHRSELLAVAAINTPISRATLENSCREQVRRITHLPGDTPGVTARMQANDMDGHLVDAAQIPANSPLSCGVVVTSSQRHLTGSLLAWGAGPLPWH